MRIKRHKKTEIAKPHLNAELFNRAEYNTVSARLDMAVWRAESNAAFRAQHGAVRVIRANFKDVESGNASR